jgi:spore coat protein U-like protein
MKPRLALAAFLLIACGAQQAAAQTYCTSYASSLAFGSYNPTTADSVTATVTVTCSSGNVFHIGLNAGTGTGATTTTRIMHSGTNLLNYQLFQDSAHTINWGNNPPTDTVNGTGDGTAHNFTVYATVPAGQFVPPASNYVDTITATVTNGSASPPQPQIGETATVLAGCSASATDLNFGNYLASLVSATSTVTVSCTNSTTYSIGLNAGGGVGGSTTTRKMTSPALATLNYKMFRDSAHTLNWGNSPGTDTVAGVGNGVAQQSTVYGQMAAGQSGNPAIYSDTITATVTY